MGPEAILLSMHAGDGDGMYSFICPVCLEDVQKEADPKIVALLMSAGVPVADGSDAADTVPGDLPPLTMDDLIGFHFLLQNDDYLDRFLAER
jgi:hypothetical protein